MQERSFTSTEKRFLLITPIVLLILLAGCYFGFWRLAYEITIRLGKDNPNSEKLMTDGRIITSTIIAGAIGSYLRIALNLDDVKKLESTDSTFIFIIQMICGGLAGLFVYLVAESQLLLKILYIGDLKGVTLDWNGSMALALFSGLLSKQIISGILRSRP
jgi:hypothetical protein